MCWVRASAVGKTSWQCVQKLLRNESSSELEMMTNISAGSPEFPDEAGIRDACLECVTDLLDLLDLLDHP